MTIVISSNYSLNSFREDLQKMFRRAGLKGEGLLFLLTDSQVPRGRRGLTGLGHRSVPTWACG